MGISIFRKTFEDKAFLKATASFTIPVMLTMVLSTVTNLVDTMMVGTLGEASISAVGLANKYFYVFSMVIFGVHSGSGLLMAQFYGSDDAENIRRTFGLGLLINLIASFLFAFVACIFPIAVMSIFTDSAVSTELGIRYLRIAGLSFPLFAVSNILSSLLRATRNVRVPVVASVVSILTNVLFNYCLIFGRAGFPAMGIEGAAIATVIARIAELLILLLFSLRKGSVLRGKLGDFVGWSGTFLRNFVRCSLPILINEILWGFGTTLYYVAYGHMGDNATAAITITETVTKILNTAGNGLASAASVLLGNELGAGKLKKAEDNSAKLLVLGLTVALICSVLLLIFRNPVLGLFDVSEEVRLSASVCMAIYAAILPFYYTYCIIIVGILRAGGDSKASLFLDSSGVWFIALPLIFLGAFVWKLPITAVFALSLVEEVYKTILSLIRWRKKVWLRNLTSEF